MTAATATPRVMRDRLLQAIDGQSNIRNMMVVVEVISSLEKYPVTTEVLEETRLGKLINDIRKKTKNEDLAKRAKRLLRNWQRLIDPAEGGLLGKGLAGASWSSKGGAPPCSSPPAAPAALSKTGPELKARSDFNNCSPKLEQIGNRKRRCDLKEGHLLPTKKPKPTRHDAVQHSKQLPSTGLGGRFKFPANIHTQQPLDRGTSNPLDSNVANKVPVHAVKARPSASVHSKPPSTVEQVGWDKPASGGQHQPRGPRFPLQLPENPKQEAVVKKAVSKTQSGAGPGAEVSVRTDRSGSAHLEPRSRTTSNSRCESVSLVDEDAANDAGRKKRQKHGAKDYVLNLDGPIREDSGSPARLKERRITFDPSTGQIKRACPKDSPGKQEVSGLQSSEPSKQSQPAPPPPLPPPSPFQQTDWKELSRSEIIQSYLSQQSNILSSSGLHTPTAHVSSSVTETRILASKRPAKELPGVGREISSADLKRLQGQRWSGVNGCYDTQGNWYDWTECISLDPHGDDSRLNILPYVCLD
ncbi:mediator of RNA polymerase II transcription subunit 26 [Fundulus heteroclitus]|uniref:mediator of RNA polymerase II transcription subunit 26 n=1 Tax=Fundulus heteroclitus TaxID=8078 RepID=UPI00165BFAD0|nr:mediator of RNA polymerase II transcription subunit 26 [Fundulus heteroclitus]